MPKDCMCPNCIMPKFHSTRTSYARIALCPNCVVPELHYARILHMPDIALCPRIALCPNCMRLLEIACARELHVLENCMCPNQFKSSQQVSTDAELHIRFLYSLFMFLRRNGLKESSSMVFIQHIMA